MTPALLAASRVTKRFGRRVAVEEVSLTVTPGEVTALLGPNGAGKTTLLRMLAGLLAPSMGHVSVDDVPQSPGTWPVTRGRVGFLTEVPGLWSRLSVEANLLAFARLHGVPDARKRVSSLLDAFDLGPRSHDPAGTLSKGMQQKVALARTLLHDPGIVLLDEPTAGLDPDMTIAVRDLIVGLRGEGRAVLVATHDLSEAERIADRVAVLDTTILAFDQIEHLRRAVARHTVRIELADPAGPFADGLHGLATDPVVSGTSITCRVENPERVPAIVSALVSQGARIMAVRPHEPSLEDIYVALSHGRGARRTSKGHS